MVAVVDQGDGLRDFLYRSLLVDDGLYGHEQWFVLVVCDRFGSAHVYVFDLHSPGYFVFPGFVITLIMILLCNPMFMFFSFVMAINGLLHYVLLGRAATADRTWSFKQVLVRSTSATCFAFLVGILIGLPGYTKLVEFKRGVQLTDLSDRLAYEESSNAAGLGNQSVPPLGVKIDADFVDEEYQLSYENYWGRVSGLRALHSGRVETFTKSPGFGVGRFGRTSIERMSYPELQNIGFDVVPEAQLDQLDWQQRRQLKQVTELIDDKRSFHWQGVRDFVDPEASGFVVEPKVAFGYRPHAFTLPLQNVGQKFLGAASLKLSRLQLISLLRFESPRAYVLDQLPRMDQLVAETTPTRVLTEFERASIKKLTTNGKSILYQPLANDRLEMVGAIRAYDSCLNCHNVRRGELLGAFTYQFEAASTKETH
jgi:hypothetical protein